METALGGRVESVRVHSASPQTGGCQSVSSCPADTSKDGSLPVETSVLCCSFAVGCREVFGGFQCICRDGYTGDKCQR